VKVISNGQDETHHDTGNIHFYSVQKQLEGSTAAVNRADESSRKKERRKPTSGHEGRKAERSPDKVRSKESRKERPRRKEERKKAETRTPHAKDGGINRVVEH